MQFIIEQLYRVTAPGCNVCVHIQQLLAYKNQHGFSGRRDFRGAVIDMFRRGGSLFRFIGEFVIPKDPQAMAQRLNLHSLQFKTGYARNACNLAPAVNDYVLIFQKPGECASPVRCIQHKTKNPGGWITTEDWVRWASGVWDDIDEFDIIDGARHAKEHNEEKHVCLARGSLVLTRDGYIPIETVKVGDLVFTHRSRWRPVLATQIMGVKSVVQLEAQGVPHLRLTPEHRLWTRSCVGRGGKGRKAGSMEPSSHRRRARTANPDWVEARSTKGSYINLKLPSIEESAFTADEWWIVGRWLGDGHFDARGRVHITCAIGETSKLKSQLGKRCGAITKRKSVNQIAVNDRDGRIRTILSRCGRGCEGKTLPAEAMALDPSRAESLLAGYLSADGHYVAKYKRWTATSVSRRLLLGMALVAQRARCVVASVYAGKPPGVCTIEGRTTRTQQEWILSIPPRNVSAMCLSDGGWKKVRKVTPEPYADEVWDIQVAEDQSFTAEGCIVHNCPLQLDVIRRCVRLYTNPRSIQPDVKVLDPFMGVGSTAAICVEQDRNCIGFELKESYHRNALANVKRWRAKRASALSEASVDLFTNGEGTSCKQSKRKSAKRTPATASASA